MRLAYSYIDLIKKLIEERKALKIRYERIDTLLDRQAYNSISSADVDALNEEYDEIENKLEDIDNKLNSYYNQINVLLGIIDNDIKELTKEKASLENRLNNILETLKGPSKTYMNMYEIDALKREYHRKRDALADIKEALEVKKEDYKQIKGFIDNTELPRRRR